MPFARCHGAGRIHYAERGEPRAGRRPVLLIHGAGASSSIWMMVMARLARFTRAVAIDLPGHGPTPPWQAADGDGDGDRDDDRGADGGARPTLITYRDAAGALAAAVGLGPAVLVGHSMGALVAIEAALAWPDKVTALLLCAAAPRLPVDRDLLATLKNDYPHFPQWLAARALSPAAKPALRRAFIAAGVAAPQAVTIADFAAIQDVDLTPRLEQVRCPILWLDGADDGILVQRSRRPGQVRLLTGVGHLVPIEAPGEIATSAIGLSENGDAR